MKIDMKTPENDIPVTKGDVLPTVWAYVRVSTSKKVMVNDPEHEARKSQRKFIEDNQLTANQLMMGDWVIEYEKQRTSIVKGKTVNRQLLMEQAKSPGDIEEDIAINENGDEFVQTFDSQLTVIMDRVNKDGYVIEEENIIKDRISGAKFNRPGLTKLKESVKQGDIVYVYALDRLGRSTIDVLNLIDNLCELGVTVVIVTNNMQIAKNTTSPQDKLMFELISAFASFERSIIRQRVRSGIEAARARPNPPQFGRGDRVTQHIKDIIVSYAENGVPVKEIKQRTGVSRPVIYKIISANGITERFKQEQKNRKQRKREDFTLDGGGLTPEERAVLYNNEQS